MPKKILAFPVEAVLLALAACLTAGAVLAATTPVDVIAEYREGTVEAAEFESWLAFRGLPDDPATRLEEVRGLLVVKELAGVATERGSADDPAVRGAIRAAEDQLFAAALRRQRAAAVQIDEAEVEALRLGHPEAFTKPRRWRLRNLFKRLPPDASAEALAALRARMEELRAAVVAGADFATLANSESDSETHLRGGLIGNVGPGELQPEVEAAAFALSAGEVSPVLEVSGGLLLLQCERIVEAKAPTPEEARAKIAANLRTMRVREDWEALERDLLEVASPSYDLTRLEQADAELVRYAGGAITRAELDMLLAASVAGRGVEELDAAQIEKFLARAVLERTAAARARELGLAEDPVVARSLPWARRQLLASAELRSRVVDRLEPFSEGEIRKFFDDNPEIFVEPAQFEVSVIRLSFNASTQAEQASLAHDLLRSAAASEEAFAAAARLHSDGPGAADGGYLGWQPKPRLASTGFNLLRALELLSPGEVSRPFQDDGAYWLARLHAAREAAPLSFEAARSKAENRLGNARAQELQADIVAELESALKVELAPR